MPRDAKDVQKMSPQLSIKRRWKDFKIHTTEAIVSPPCADREGLSLRARCSEVMHEKAAFYMTTAVQTSGDCNLMKSDIKVSFLVFTLEHFVQAV